MSKRKQKKNRSNIGIAGFTISMTWIAVIALYFFVKSLNNQFEDLFIEYNTSILVVSGIAVLLLIWGGYITLRKLKNKGKDMF